MLKEILATDLFKLFLIMARLGAAVMLAPGFGSTMVNTRARLMLALSISFLLLPVLAPELPRQPATVPGFALLILGEVTVGLFFGLLVNILTTALDFAGTFLSYAIGLTNAFTFDPVSATQSQILVGFLTMTALTLIFITDTHHLILRAVVDSYGLFPPGRMPAIDDMTTHMIKMLGTSYVIGMRVAAPVVVFSLAVNVALGLLNRLVPQMQVFFVGLPVQILAGLTVLTISLPVIMIWFLRHLQDGIGVFTAS